MDNAYLEKVLKDPLMVVEVAAKKGVKVRIEKLINYLNQIKAIDLELEKIKKNYTEINLISGLILRSRNPFDVLLEHRDQLGLDLYEKYHEILEIGKGRFKEELNTIKSEIDQLNTQKKNLVERVNDFLDAIPNTPLKQVEVETLLYQTQNRHLRNRPEIIINSKLGELLAADGYIVAEGSFIEFKNKIQNHIFKFFREAGYRPVTIPTVTNSDTLFGYGGDVKGLVQLDEKTYLSNNPEINLSGYFIDQTLEGEVKTIFTVANCFHHNRNLLGDEYTLANSSESDIFSLYQVVRPELYEQHWEILFNNLIEFYRSLSITFKVDEIPTNKLSFASAYGVAFKVYDSKSNQYKTLGVLNNYTNFHIYRNSVCFNSGEAYSIGFSGFDLNTFTTIQS